MLCYHYPPASNAAVRRSVKFAGYLPLYGWTPVVVTTSTHGTAESKERVVRTPDLHLWLSGKVLRKTGTFPENKGPLQAVVDWTNRWLFIPDVKILWALSAFLPSWRLLRHGEADVIFTTSSPVSAHLAGLMLKLLTGKPWVMDLRDPWTFEPLSKHLRKRGLRRLIEENLEQICFRNADAVILNTPEAAENYKLLYRRYAGKMLVITNGFDREDLERAAGQTIPLTMPLKSAGNNLKSAGNKMFVISHVGNFSRRTDREATPHSLLNALKALRDDGIISADNCRVVFAGDLHPATVKRITELGLDGLIELPGLLSHSDALKLMANSDLLLLFDPNEAGKTYVHTKLYEYLGTSKTVLGMVPEGASRNLLKRFGTGLLASPEDSEEIQQAIAAAIEKRPALPSASEGDISVYEWKQLAGQLAECLNSLRSPDA